MGGLLEPRRQRLQLAMIMPLYSAWAARVTPRLETKNQSFLHMPGDFGCLFILESVTLNSSQKLCEHEEYGLQGG